MSIQILCPFFKLNSYLFIIELYQFLIYSGRKPLIRYMICKFSPILWVVFSFYLWYGLQYTSF